MNTVSFLSLSIFNQIRKLLLSLTVIKSTKQLFATFKFRDIQLTVQHPRWEDSPTIQRHRRTGAWIQSIFPTHIKNKTLNPTIKEALSPYLESDDFLAQVEQ
jgi:hypothetical protein